MDDSANTPWMTRLVDQFLRGDVALLLIILALLLGTAALLLTPREEEPQIVVPLADVFVSAAGLSAEEVEQQVTDRLEKLLYQIDGVEDVYSVSRPGKAVITVRFYVGEDREDSLLKLYSKIYSHVDNVPPAVTSWVVKPVEVDDVPIVNVTLWSEDAEVHGDHELRRLAEQVQHDLQAIPNTNRVWVIGGRPRRIRVQLDPARLAARKTSALDVAAALRAANVNRAAGGFEQQDQYFEVEAGRFLAHTSDVENLVIHTVAGQPVYLQDVAQVIDGPAEPESYSWIGFGPAAGDARPRPGRLYPAVHIAIAKRKGTNAVWVADAVQQRMAQLADLVLPHGVHYQLTRNYGETANDKVNELVEALAVAVLTVIGLIGLVLGWRPALVIALAIPVCYSLTLFINLLAGYTINRVTLFALILSLGLLVDDPITDVENIARYFKMRRYKPREAVLRAVQEVRPALILSTLAIIASFLPLALITGMMGPYMAPMALNVPLTVTVSTLVAFVITPWLAMVALGKSNSAAAGGGEEPLQGQPLYRFYQAVLGPVLARRGLSWAVLAVIGFLLLVAMVLPLFRMVPLKMLPFDNKNEFQLVLDLPEGTTLERTDAVCRLFEQYLATVEEVKDFQLYVGTSSAMDFNGLVRHYFLRRDPHLADIRVNLAPKEVRRQQSHEILLRLRNDLNRIARQQGADVKLVEVPPGPPVLSTITAEVYGPPQGDYQQLIEASVAVRDRLAREPLVVDVDSSAAAEHPEWIFTTDKTKAALSGVSTQEIADTIDLALRGLLATVLHQPAEVDPLWVELRLPRAKRSAIDDLLEIYVRGEDDQIVQIGELGRFQQVAADQPIYHKNLQRVVFVYGEVAGRPPADAILDVVTDRQPDGASPDQLARRAGKAKPVERRTWLAPGGGDPWALPAGYRVEWAGEGEWKITLDVFRDLGVAFAAALLGIFVILMFQTGSRSLPLVIMLAIPLTLIGIMPGFWLLNVIVDRPLGGYPNPVFFTATAMIGMIALAGIVVRNSVVLIDFIHHGEAEGLSVREAIIRSVAVRTRPILLTAGTTLLGNWVITLDPIFSGLAWSIIFGIVTSTLFTLIVIPVVYWLLYGTRTSD